MKIRKTIFLFLFIIAFIFRASLSTLINKGDVLAIEEWSRNLYQQGLAGSYFRDGWVYTAPTQPPLMMSLYRFSRYLYEQRFRLSQLHNLTRLPPTFLILWFDKNGPLFSVRLWGILADLLSAATIYFLVKKTAGEKRAFWATIFLLFNPILFFDSSVWGQVDLLSSLMAFVALFFLVHKNNWVNFFSPVIFTTGILLKPTIIVVAPLYLALITKKYLLSKERKNFSWVIGGMIVSLILVFLSFVPFWDKAMPFLKYTESVITRRMLPSAKGISRAATSGFTFYPIFFEIDRTLGNTKIGLLTLDQIGYLVLVVLFFLTIRGIFSIKKLCSIKGISLLAFWGYFIAEGSFLFQTNMAERYFFPAFIFLNLLLFLVNDWKIRLLIIFQQIVWLVNLVVSFFLSDCFWFQQVFRNHLYSGTRLFSLFNVLLFFLISSYFLKGYSIISNIRIIKTSENEKS